jgi:hypothetical protein
MIGTSALVRNTGFLLAISTFFQLRLVSPFRVLAKVEKSGCKVDLCHEPKFAKDRRHFLANVLISPTITVSQPQFAGAKIATIEPSLDSIDWNAPKNVGLNTERMSDAINDGLKETQYFVTGMGRPEFFSDRFVYVDDSTGNRKLTRGFEAYCRSREQLYRQEPAVKCELVCCSVTAPHTISLLWRLSGLQTETPKLVQSILTTDARDGLVVQQVDTLVQSETPSLEILQSKCDWYTCTLRS